MAKRILRHPGSRWTAWLVLAGMVVGLWGPGAAPAAAQEVEARSVVVLDFQDPTGGGLVGRAATSALTLAMTEKGYQVVPRIDVQEALLRLGLRPPYEPDEVRKLAVDLDAEQVIAGRVLHSSEGAGTPAWVHVDLRIEVYDGETGDMINGAITTGVEQGLGGGAGQLEELRSRAIESAMARGLEEIERRTLVQAAVTVPVPRRPEIILNRGTRFGVNVGMEFDAFRTKVDPADPTRAVRVKIARVKVVEVSADEGTAQVIHAEEGIREGDLLREVFRLPEYVPPTVDPATGEITPPRPRPRGGSGGGALMGVLGVVAGLGILAGLLSMNSNTNRDAPVADAARGAYLRQSQPGVFPSVVIEWADRDFTPPRNFIGGYLVYRGASPAFSATEGEAVGAVTGATQRTFSDDPQWFQLETTMPVRYLRREGEDSETVTAELDITIVHQSVQPGQTYYYKVRRVGPASVLIPPDLIVSSGSNRSRQRMRRAASGNVLRSGGNISVRVRRQQVVHRQVSNIPPGPNYDTTLDPFTDNDIAPDDDIGISDPTPGIGPVTYIVPPELLAPANSNQAQRVDDVNFQWQNQFGASEYVLQLSEEVDFGTLAFVSRPIRTTSPTQQSFRYDASEAGFVTLKPNTTYFWRVGARSTFGNQRPPEPDGYVFSSVFTFTTADQPPTAP